MGRRVRRDGEPFPFADLFAHGWIAGDRTPPGGHYLVACLGCKTRLKLQDVPHAVPEIEHDEDCPVAAYIARPEGGTKGWAHIWMIVHADTQARMPTYSLVRTGRAARPHTAR